MPAKPLFASLVIAAASLLGCASDDQEPAAPQEEAKYERPRDRMPLSELSAECRGFDVVGLKYSPGGEVLPNLCAPFDGTYNNPYAIRCVDADPSFDTGWRGDEFCILPPPPELGMQVHIGPQNYDDHESYAAFLLKPGEEINTNYFIKGSNEEVRHYYRTNWRMRDGSHHMIVNMLEQDRDEGWDTEPDRSFSELGLRGTGFGGSQRTDSDRPQGTLDVPPENAGIGGELRAKPQFAFNLHHMNRFEETILREVWMNVWYMPAEAVTRPIQGLAAVGNPLDVIIPDGEHRVLHYKTQLSGSARIITLFGHRHANTDRFGIWVERKSGEVISVYESFEYTDMPVYQYDSVSHNPAPDVAHRVDGGYSGLLELADGDALHFLCDINNRSGVTLEFVNELRTGEMCIAFGTTTGSGRFPFPVRVQD